MLWITSFVRDRAPTKSDTTKSPPCSIQTFEGNWMSEPPEAILFICGTKSGVGFAFQKITDRPREVFSTACFAVLESNSPKKRASPRKPWPFGFRKGNFWSKPDGVWGQTSFQGTDSTCSCRRLKDCNKNPLLQPASGQRAGVQNRDLSQPLRKPS